MPVLFGLLNGYAQDNQLSNADSSSYEVDFRLLQEHVQKNMTYPEEARVRGIQGIVFVQFLVDEKGNIIANSVKTTGSLFQSCDREAERIIKSYRAKWTITSNEGKPVTQRFVIPIQFVLTKQDGLEFPTHFLPFPVQTVVIPKGITTKYPDWAVYARKGMRNVIGKISPGDSLSVIGWAAWSYFIQGKNTIGYVSRYSLYINSELDSLAKLIEKQSENEDEFENKEMKLNGVDTVYNFSSENSYLSFTSNKRTIYRGECFTGTFSFNVKENNQFPLQFLDLGHQLSRILNAELNFKDGFVSDNHIENIEGVERFNGKEKYVSYTIHQASYCPTKNDDIRFPEIKLYILLRKKALKEAEKILEYHSLPLVVDVKPLIPGLELSESDGYKMVGKFWMNEEVNENDLMSGKLFSYKIKVIGEGLIFPIKPPKLVGPGMNAQLQDIHDSDTIINEILYSSKTFAYHIMFNAEGTYDLNNKIKFTFFNPASGKAETIRSKMKLVVRKSPDSKIIKPKEKFYLVNNFIAVDASQSMMIEDYFPTRLAVVKEGLKKFLSKRTFCDIGIIAFGGDAKHFNISNSDSCYSAASLDNISFNVVSKGTAIGDAIWLAKNSMMQGPALKKLVIIGDGDNTAGVVKPYFAAQIAKRNNLQIYTIGIGKKGAVPFGKDERGNPNMIDNTFTDNDFKEIARITGGKYYWAKDADEISRILDLIFRP